MKNIIIVACCRSGHNFVINQINSWKLDHAIIHNWEDLKPEDYEAKFDYWREAGVIDNYFDIETIIVVRDLLNWWASYLKWITRDGEVSILKLQTAFSIWHQHLLAAKGLTNYMPNAITVHFDEFAMFNVNRKKLCDYLAGQYSEERLDIILPAGNGSSFDKDIPGSDMKIYTRYKEILKSPLKEIYLEMLRRNPASVEMYRNYFPAYKPKIKIIDSL